MQRMWSLALGLAVVVAAESAMALDIDGTRYAALDQPVINVAFKLSADGAYISYESFTIDFSDLENPLVEIDSISTPFYFDTGASAGVISAVTYEALGLAPIQFGGETVVAGDVGVGGIEDFNVSPQVWIDLAAANSLIDPQDPASYTQSFGPVRLQLQIAEPTGDPILDQFPSGFDVLGMPFFSGKTVVIDVRPSNAFLDTPILLDPTDPFNVDEPVEVNLRTYVYNPTDTYNPSTLDTNPGVVPTDVQVQLSYGNFRDYTILTPDGGPGPTLEHNPFIGTAPTPDVVGGIATPPTSAPQAAIRDGDATARGSLLFDTGGSVSILSTAMAAQLGITVGGTAENPQLFRDGVAVTEQFTVEVEGVGGMQTLVGLYLDELIIPTIGADASNLDDPDHLHFQGAPFFILDLTLQNPDDPTDTVTLDGVFGMNYLMPSTEVEYLNLGGLGQFPFPVNQSKSAFDWVVFDEPTGVLGLSIIPEPGTLLLLAGGASLLIVRRRHA